MQIICTSLQTQDPPWEGTIFFGEGKERPIVKYRDTICAKTAKPIEMSFGLWTWMGPRNHVLDGGPQVLRDVAMATIFGLLMGYIFWLYDS